MKTMVVKSRNDGIIRHLKSWGLDVEWKPGFRERGRPYNFYPRAVICHHTASNRNSGNFPSENIVTNGRSDLAGPLCHFLLGRNGTVKIIASGYANHAGYGGPEAGIPKNMGNSYSYGIEAENDGVGEPWSKEQLNAYYQLCAALLSWMNISDVSKVFGHKEWAPGRKIDPNGIDMNKFRANVKKALNAGPRVQTVRLSRLKPGKRNADVLAVKRRLAKKGFGAAADTNFFGKGFKHDYRSWQTRLGYSGKQADGVPGKGSLEKLGFRVLP